MANIDVSSIRVAPSTGIELLTSMRMLFNSEIQKMYNRLIIAILLTW